MVKPDAMIGHEAEEVLRRPSRRSTFAADSCAPLAAHIGGKRKRRFVDGALRVIKILHLDAVVGVETIAIRYAEIVCPPIIIAENRNRAVWTPKNLHSHSRALIELTVRLPAVDDPGLDLQFVAGEDL